MHLHGFQINLLRDDVKLRKALFEIFCIPPLIAWVLLGADSTVDQVANMLFNVPNFLLGRITFNGLLQIYQSYYGLGTHWSAAVIYSLLFIGLSKHLREKLEVTNSLNLAITTGFVGITIASFEFFWQISYAVFQNQWWVVTFRFPQARILIQNIMFMTTGLLVLIGFNWKDYKLNIDKMTVLAFLVTIGFIFLWWFFPFQTTQITVPTEAGLWTSAHTFPQTMYTIEMNVGDAFGKMFYAADPYVHLVNNLSKIFMTLTFYSSFKVKRRHDID